MTTPVTPETAERTPTPEQFVLSQSREDPEEETHAVESGIFFSGLLPLPATRSHSERSLAALLPTGDARTPEEPRGGQQDAAAASPAPPQEQDSEAHDEESEAPVPEEAQPFEAEEPTPAHEDHRHTTTEDVNRNHELAVSLLRAGTPFAQQELVLDFFQKTENLIEAARAELQEGDRRGKTLLNNDQEVSDSQSSPLGQLAKLLVGPSLSEGLQDHAPQQDTVILGTPYLRWESPHIDAVFPKPGQAIYADRLFSDVSIAAVDKDTKPFLAGNFFDLDDAEQAELDVRFHSWTKAHAQSLGHQIWADRWARAARAGKRAARGDSYFLPENVQLAEVREEIRRLKKEYQELLSSFSSSSGADAGRKEVEEEDDWGLEGAGDNREIWKKVAPILVQRGLWPEWVLSGPDGTTPAGDEDDERRFLFRDSLRQQPIWNLAKQVADVRSYYFQDPVAKVLKEEKWQNGFANLWHLARA